MITVGGGDGSGSVGEGGVGTEYFRETHLPTRNPEGLTRGERKVECAASDVIRPCKVTATYT